MIGQSRSFAQANTGRPRRGIGHLHLPGVGFALSSMDESPVPTACDWTSPKFPNCWTGADIITSTACTSWPMAMTPRPPAIAQQNDFREVDVRLTLDRPIQTEVRFPRCAGLSSSTGARIRPRGIAATGAHSSPDSRFYYDEHFDRDRCGLLYAAWIDKSFSDPAQAVLFPRVTASPLGYITCETRGPETQIGLLGVAPDYAGQGLGKALVQQFITWSALKGSRRAKVVTQERNSAAQGLYRHCGFLPASLQRWYHRWFTND